MRILSSGDNTSYIEIDEPQKHADDFTNFTIPQWAPIAPSSWKLVGWSYTWVLAREHWRHVRKWHYLIPQ